MEESAPQQVPGEAPQQQDQSDQVQMSDSVKEKIQSTNQLNFTEFEQCGWKIYSSSYPMSNSGEMEAAQDQVATMGLPEVFYGNNYLFLARPEHNFLLEINAVDSISFTSFEKRNACQRDLANQQVISVDLTGDSQQLNLIDAKPKSLKVREAQIWQKKDTSKIDHFAQVEVISDWTYSTPYNGSVNFLSKRLEAIRNATSLVIEPGPVPDPQAAIKVELTEEEIPFHRLGPDNPIVHSGQIYLFECDLEDSGYTMGQCRYRVMNDSWYVLLRSYIRVDGVCVRIFDTRLFHDFNSRCIMREFSHREATYDQLREAGFSPSSEWMLSQTQADEVAQFAPLQKKVNDRIIF